VQEDRAALPVAYRVVLPVPYLILVAASAQVKLDCCRSVCVGDCAGLDGWCVSLGERQKERGTCMQLAVMDVGASRQLEHHLWYQ
jgi:hypothetical protein